ncbi:DUF6262 family protein, partial [Actinomadura adrarensis]
DQPAAGRRVLPAPRQGACTYANICEHCPSFHSEPSTLPVLAAQRIDAQPSQKTPKPGLNHRDRAAPQAHHPPGHLDQPSPSRRGANRMTSTDTLNRVEQTCAELLADGHTITFTAVAERSGLGRTTLYRNAAARAVIEEHRTRAAGATTISGLATQIATLQTALDAIAARVRHHEEQLRRLDRRAT